MTYQLRSGNRGFGKAILSPDLFGGEMRAEMPGGVGALNRLLLMGVEAIRKQSMIGGHDHLQRLNHAFEMFDALQEIAQSRATLGLL